ncbi:MAG: phosphoserine phosphatase SerB, partial [Pseudomonadota bacterium]
GELTEAHVAQVAAAMRTIEGEISNEVWLTDGEAAEMSIDSEVSDGTIVTAARYILGDAKIDIGVQKVAEDRRRKLLVADMDATMVVGETLDDLAAKLGLGEKVAEITTRAMRGEVDFAGALRERVAMLKGHPSKAIDEIANAAVLSPGAETLLKTMGGWGAKRVLVSGGFTPVTSVIAEKLGFDLHHGNTIGVADGAFDGSVADPIFDGRAKMKTLLTLCAEGGLALKDAIAVGDGANDADMVEIVSSGSGIGASYYGKPKLDAVSAFHIKHTDLTALLFMQGVPRKDFAA